MKSYLAELTFVLVVAAIGLAIVIGLLGSIVANRRLDSLAANVSNMQAQIGAAK